MLISQVLLSVLDLIKLVRIFWSRSDGLNSLVTLQVVLNSSKARSVLKVLLLQLLTALVCLLLLSSRVELDLLVMWYFHTLHRALPQTWYIGRSSCLPRDEAANSPFTPVEVDSLSLCFF